jgi:hypothetical protein
MRYSRFVSPLRISLLTATQLHPTAQQRRTSRLHASLLPVPLLAASRRRPAALLPLPPGRHLALHHLLDASPRRGHTSHRRAMGVHGTVAQLEADVGRPGAVSAGRRG